MLPAKYSPILFALLLSGMMSCMVCFVATLKSIGMPAEFLWLWMSNWLASWCVAFPAALICAPFVRRVVARITYDDRDAAARALSPAEHATGNRV